MENLSPTGRWRFTIYVENKPKFFMFIGKHKGEYKVTRLRQTNYDLEKELINFKNGINASNDPTYIRIGAGDYIVGVGNGTEKATFLDSRSVKINKNNSISLKHDITESKKIIQNYYTINKKVKDGKVLEIPLGGPGAKETLQISPKSSRYDIMEFKYGICKY